MDEDPKEPAIKGAVIREMLLWYHDAYGNEAFARLPRRLSPDALALLDFEKPALGVLPSTWYPASLTHPILDAVCDEHGHEGREIARAANAAVVPRMIRGVYRVLFKMAATPERYARQIPRLWRTLHTTGERHLEVRAPGEIFSVTQDWAGHHPMLCWLTLYTMAYVFEAMGYRDWELDRVGCVSHGGKRCETVFRYRR